MSNWNGTAYHLKPADVESAFRTILSSELMQTRPEQCARLMQETIIEVNDHIVINAYASRYSDEDIREQMPTDPEKAKNFIPKRYRVIICRGLLEWMSAVGVVTAVLDRTGSVRKARGMLKWMAKASTQGCVGSDFMLRLWERFHLKEDSVQEEVARMYAKTILLEVVAHECGHICLGHIPPNGEDPHMSISRNNERQADSWAAAVIQSCCLGAQGAVGSAMSLIGLMWAHSISEAELRFSSHPMHLERLSQFMQDFDAMFTVSHIRKSQLMELLP